MILYLAGKMTGTPDMGRNQFNEAERQLTEIGYTVINPAKLPLGLHVDSYMPISMAMIDACDYVVLLDGYETSRGALLEKAYAEYQGKGITTEFYWGICT